MNKLDYKNDLKGKFSLRPLIKFWEKAVKTNKVYAAAFNDISERLKSAPELTVPITDLSVIDKHRELIEDLLSICFSPAISQNEYYAAVLPHNLQSFYETPAFKTLNLFDNQTDETCFNENCCITPDGRISANYVTMLKYFYGLNVSYEYPIIYTFKDKLTGLDRHFRIRIFAWFGEFKIIGEKKKLTEDEKKRLFDNLDNPKVLMEIIPPETFEFEGFAIFNAVDITDQETISSLKYDLIEKESIMSVNKYENLQHKVRTLLKKPGVKLGLIAFPSANKSLQYGIKIGDSIILDDKIQKELTDCKIYSNMLRDRNVKIIYDMDDNGECLIGEPLLIKHGIRNLLLAPLIYKDDLIGIFELGSSNPGDLNKINTLKLKDVFPLFAICLKSSLDDMNKSIQSVIKEKCTAIHPSVEWRFRDAALMYLNNLRNNVYEEMEDIVFDNVYPFYGTSDVKDSSVLRNSAIQWDLIENLKHAHNIFQKASKLASMPILEELNFRIMNNIEILNKGLNSSDEVSIINFLKNEIETSFTYLNEISPEIDELITSYRSKMDPDFGFLCIKRKDFEESISLLNETIATELDIQQDKAQKIFPHYFEKYKTDGVEHNMYLGQSLSADKKFNPMHLKSLRLWQLVTMCIVAKKCIEIKSSLKVPLDAAHLLYVQNSPLTIKFLYDEKKFDVAGSYNIRYEIIKKRIDKAEIKGGNERVVAPGKIAIIYSQDTEAEEYQQYINFLKTKNYITGDVENLELADMQGIQGLKALRITVNNDMVVEKSEAPHVFEHSMN